MDKLTPNWLESARYSLESKVFDQGVHYRILFIGRSTNASTDIVSCLSRSLRNLGHHLLDIDLEKHRDITETPQDLALGQGPVFIRPNAIDKICATFQPQIIICCSGGLTLHPEHAEQIKKNGVILIGITLLDPDVFTATAPHAHAHVFDFHTTNARYMLDMYQKTGCNNTLYFPFGIDREFITQAVPHAPELTADVICTGQAAGQPEHIKLMQTLAKSFEVKVYGNGWELPKNEPVSGIRLIQAMRAGKIHMDFPLSPTGHININCGIFESVGSGAVLCTGQFDEVADFFHYDSEIIGYENETELVAKLSAVLNSPERYLQLTQAAFSRVVSEHLYEHRWMALLETVFNCSLDSTPWLKESRIQSIRKTLARSSPRAKHVVLSGFYGANNLGDELILRSIQSALVRCDPSVQVTVAAENPANVERDHGLQAFARKNLNDAQHYSRTAAAIVIGGGGLWHDYTFAQSGGLLGIFQEPQVSMAGFSTLPMLGHFFRTPCHVVGMGVGPITDPDAFRMLRFVGELAESIYVRDDESFALLTQAGVSQNKFFMAPDIVYALDIPEVKPSESLTQLKESGYTVIGINLRPWSKCDEQELSARLAGVLQSLAQSTKLAIVTTPMQAGATVDELTLSKFVLACGEDIKAIQLKAPLSLEELVSTLMACDALLAMRLHACLVAHRLRKPVVGIAYDPKVASHFGQISRSAFSMALDAPAGDIENILRTALAEQGQLPESTHRTLQTLEVQANDAINVAGQQVAATPRTDKVFVAPKAVETLRHRINALTPLALPPQTKSTLTGLVATGVGFNATQIQSAFRSHTTCIELNLPTDYPKAGEAMVCDGNLLIDDACAELNFLLETNYFRLDYAGHIVIRLQLGELQLTEDLTHEKGTIRIHLGIPEGKRTLPVRLELQVLKNTFQSGAWPRVTRVTLDINTQSVSLGARRSTGYLLASRGTVSRLAMASPGLADN